MAKTKSKQNKIQRLVNQQFRHIDNPKMVEKLQGRIDTIKNTDK
jgi:hypothetical protein